MRIPSYQDHADTHEDRAMTPMIDVVFLLLIFFVCASAGQIPESIFKTELAAGGIASAESMQRDPWITEVWLRLERGAEETRTRVSMNERELAGIEDLQLQLKELAQAAPDIPVILDIQPDVPVEDFILVNDMCREAGFQSIHFAADPEHLAPAP